MLSKTEPKPNVTSRKKKLAKFHWKFHIITKRYYLCLPTQMKSAAFRKQKTSGFLLARSSLHASKPEVLHLMLPETILSIINTSYLENSVMNTND